MRWACDWRFLCGVARGLSEMAVYLRVAGVGRVQAARDGATNADFCPGWNRNRPLLHDMGYGTSEMRAYRGTAVPVRGRCGDRAKSWGAPTLNNRHGGLATVRLRWGFPPTE